jgi:hypothetical protein
MGKGTIVPMPGDAPKIGDMYKHYKGDLYKVTGIALNSSSDEDEWLVVYEPSYENAAAPLFVRPLAEWSSMVEWEGQTVPRFIKQ